MMQKAAYPKITPEYLEKTKLLYKHKKGEVRYSISRELSEARILVHIIVIPVDEQHRIESLSRSQILRSKRVLDVLLDEFLWLTLGAVKEMHQILFDALSGEISDSAVEVLNENRPNELDVLREVYGSCGARSKEPAFEYDMGQGVCHYPANDIRRLVKSTGYDKHFNIFREYARSIGAYTMKKGNASEPIRVTRKNGESYLEKVYWFNILPEVLKGGADIG